LQHNDELLRIWNDDKPNNRAFTSLTLTNKSKDNLHTDELFNCHMKRRNYKQRIVRAILFKDLAALLTGQLCQMTLLRTGTPTLEWQSETQPAAILMFDRGRCYSYGSLDARTWITTVRGAGHEIFG